MKKFWRSSLIFTAANFVVGLGNLAFQAIIGNHHLSDREYGLVNTTNTFVGFLGLPLAIATTAVTHYIAKFNFSGDDARLQGLLAGCQKFLLHLTIGGSLLAAVLIKPLSDFFHFPSLGLMAVALVCTLAGLWGGFVTALCQGMAWFKRLALISMLAMILRLGWGGLTAWKFPTAEFAVLAMGVALLANLVLLFWRKDLSRHAEPISPWNHEFVLFLVVSAACTGGGFCFMQGDWLIAQRYFSDTDKGAFTAAGVFARALPQTVAPLLTVLFTHRSAGQSHDSVRQQFKLLGLYSLGLAAGAIGLFVLSGFCLKVIGKDSPETRAMIGPYAVTMVFAGLIQALGMWALASRWIKISLLYGGLGLGYWLALLALGRTPAEMLRVMPATAGLTLAILFTVWWIAMRKARLKAER
jgi:O-antigen/teichoic acid export membrane protein